MSVDSPTLQRTVVKNISWLTLQDFILQPLGLIFFIVLGRTLGDQGLGLYSYVFTIGTFFSYVLDFGLTTYFWRKWSSQPAEYQKDLPVIIGYKLLLLIPFSVFFFIYVFYFEKSHSLLFFLVYILFALESLRNIPLYFAQATNQFRQVFKINLLDKGLVFILSSAVLLMGTDLSHVLIINILFRLASVVYAFYAFRQPLAIQLSVKSLVSTLKPSLVLFIVQMLSMVFFKVDTVMIRFMLNIDAVGLYSAAYKLIETSLLLPNIVLIATFSTLMNLEKSDKAQSHKLLEEIAFYLLILGVLLSVVLHLHAGDFLNMIYGQGFRMAEASLKWLGWCLPLLFVNSVLIAKMLALHKDKDLLFRALVLIIINISLNFILLPIFSIKGAAIATVVSELINTIVLLKMTAMSVSLIKLAKIIGVAVIVLGVGLVLNLHFALNLSIEVALFVVLLLTLRLFSIKRIVGLLS